MDCRDPLKNCLIDWQTDKLGKTKNKKQRGVIYFPPWQHRWCAPYCILTILQVCIIWAYKNKSCGNHLDEVGLYETICPALLHCFIEQTNARSSHTHTQKYKTRVGPPCLWAITDYIYIAVWIRRVVPLARLIVAKWTRIYHKAKALCEKWGTSLFHQSLFHSFSCSFAGACSFRAWPFVVSRLGSEPFLQQMEKLLFYHSSPLHLWDFIILISPALIEAPHGLVLRRCQALCIFKTRRACVRVCVYMCACTCVYVRLSF